MTRHNDRTGCRAQYANLSGLIVGAHDGSQIAFEALARHQHPPLIAHESRLTRERELADEAVQLAWRHIAGDLRSLVDPQTFPA